MTNTPRNPYVTAYMRMTADDLSSLSTHLNDQARFIGGPSEQAAHYQQVEALGIVSDLRTKADLYLRGGQTAKFPDVPGDLHDAFLSLAKTEAVRRIGSGEMTSFEIPTKIAAEVGVALQEQAVTSGRADGRPWADPELVARTGASRGIGTGEG